MKERAVLFGKALQMTNILRDVDRDLAIGRSYFPRPRLEAAGVTADELRSGRGREKLRPILHHYLRRTLGLYRAGWEYTLAIPRREARLRLACAWPLLIGLDTLALLARARDPYAPGTRIKVSRPEVRRILFRSATRIWSDRALGGIYEELEAKVEGALEGG
jgi:farnesyl-diphosphate farnesyltransferase